MHAVVNHHRPRHRALQYPSGVVHQRNDPLVHVYRLRRHSRYHRGQGSALELLQASREKKNGAPNVRGLTKLCYPAYLTVICVDAPG